MKSYGYELIMDLGGCNHHLFCRNCIDGYFEDLCNAIDMEKCERYWWDDVGVPAEEKQTSPHTKGTSAVQFILTSSIVVHTLDLRKEAYINLFSCKEFDVNKAMKLTIKTFEADIWHHHFLKRGAFK